MPAERRLPAEYAELEVSDGVQGAYSFQSKDYPRAYSLPSPAATLLIAPQTPPSPPAGMNLTIQAVLGIATARVTLTEVPVSHPDAIGPHLVRIWLQWGNDTPALAEPGAATSTTVFDWTSQPRPVAGFTTVKATIVFVDPLGRESAEATVTIRPTPS